MTPLVPIMLFGWILFTIHLFKRFEPHKAVILSVIGGLLALPVASYDLPLIPEYNKESAIAISLVIGSRFSRSKTDTTKMTIFDLPIIIWCFVSPVMTSLTNGLGLYDGISTSLNSIMNWGIYYWAGRKFFYSEESLKDLCFALILSCLIYIPLILFELRMSPQLSNIFYGFFPHSFLQHIRYGGYRPLVFFKHGLLLAFWMASASIAALWIWKDDKSVKIRNIQMKTIALILMVFTILCKSAGPISYMIMGTFIVLFIKKEKIPRLLLLFLLIIPVYIYTRANNIVSVATIGDYFARVFDPERIHSLLFRLRQEDIVSSKAFQQFFWGWGGYNRGRAIDPATGSIIEILDSLWIIVFSTFGAIGLISVYTSMLIGPIKVLSNKKLLRSISIYPVIISSLVIFYMVDTLINGGGNSTYALFSGALLGFYLSYSTKRDTSLSSSFSNNLRMA